MMGSPAGAMHVPGEGRYAAGRRRRTVGRDGGSAWPPGVRASDLARQKKCRCAAGPFRQLLEHSIGHEANATKSPSITGTPVALDRLGDHGVDHHGEQRAGRKRIDAGDQPRRGVRHGGEAGTLMRRSLKVMGIHEIRIRRHACVALARPQFICRRSAPRRRELKLASPLSASSASLDSTQFGRSKRTCASCVMAPCPGLFSGYFRTSSAYRSRVAAASVQSSIRPTFQLDALAPARALTRRSSDASSLVGP